jgi:hypothetical protein
MPSSAPSDAPPLRDLATRIAEQGLEDNVRELAEHGYTVIQDPVAHALTDRVREAILRLANVAPDALGGGSHNMLDKDPVFADAICVPKLLTMVEHVIGRGAQIAQVAGSVRRKGRLALGLHADNSWFPAPFPEWEIMCTACWVTDDFTLESGATLIMPGTHKLKRHPPRDVRKKLPDAQPIIAPKGSLCLWDGSVWHGNYPRQIDGERVVAHLSYVRLGFQTTENYDHLDESWLAGKNSALPELLGRTHFLNRRRDFKSTDVVSRLQETYRLVHGPRGY